MKKKLYLGVIFVVVFVLWTITLLFVDRQAIGPNESVVGYGTINKWFHELTGVNFTMYNITDYGGIPPILLGMFFGIMGLIQWIKRKSIKRVDKELLVLGFFYLVVFLVYLLFEFIVVNRRPVLINGYLEASYPSSTTFLSITFMLSAIIPAKKYITNKKIKNIVLVFIYLYMMFLIVGRVISGVHWITDIIGSLLIGIGLVNIYEYIIYRLTTNNT